MTNLQRPATASHRSLARRAGKGILFALSLLIAITALALILSTVLMSMFDSTEQWQAWRTDHYWSLAIWRLLVYAFLVVGWLKLKAQMPQSKRTENRRELRKLEVLVVLLFVMIELSKAFLPSGGIQ